MEKEDKIIYKWSFSDVHSRWKLWYIVTLSIVLWLVIWWILTKQYWFSFILILACWVYLFVNNNSSEVIDVKISETWIYVENSFYNYWKIENYSIIYDWWLPVLLKIRTKRRWISVIELKINDEISEELKNILPNFLSENKEDNELSNTDKIINFLKL